MRVIDYNGDDTCLLYYDSVSSIANTQVDACNKDKWSKVCSSENDSVSWLGMPTRAEVRNAVELNGWNSGVEKGLEAIGEIETPSLPTLKKKRCFKNYGHCLDVTRIYTGKPEAAWHSFKREMTSKNRSKKTLVNVMIDISTSCGISSDKFFWRGALGMLMAKSLMESGRNVRILCCFSIKGAYKNWKGKGNKALNVAVNIKDFNQPIDLTNMFSTTALSGFFRHYGFKAILSNPFKAYYSLGHPNTLKVQSFDPILDSNPCLVIENVWSAEQARDKAKNLIEEVLEC